MIVVDVSGFFFFSSRRRHTRYWRDWSSDVCSSDLALLGGHARSVEAEYLLRNGWAGEITVPREDLRRRVSVAVTGDSAFDLARDPAARTARLPREAFETIRTGIATGPVLVQTPRT